MKRYRPYEFLVATWRDRVLVDIARKLRDKDRYRSPECNKIKATKFDYHHYKRLYELIIHHEACIAYLLIKTWMDMVFWKDR